MEHKDEYIAQLMAMGFPIDRCEKALNATHFAGIDHAVNW